MEDALRGRGRGGGRGRGRGRGRGFIPEEPIPQVAPNRTAEERFRKEKPPTFDGLGEPADAEKWVRAIERIFNYIRCDDEDKVSCATYQLVDEADFWWESVRRTMTDEQWEDFTWEEFKAELYEKYIPGCYRQKKQNEFYNLRQKTGTVTEYDRAFNQLSRYAPTLVDSDEKHAEKFRNGLRHEIAISLASQGGLTYAQTLSRALTIESLLPREKGKSSEQSGFIPSQDGSKGKRKWNEGTGGNFGNGKKPWMANQNQNQYQNPQPQAMVQTPCPKCQKLHLGECLKGMNVCYNCGEAGHYVSTCPKKGGGAPQQQNPGNQQQQNQGPRGDQGQPRYVRAYALNQHQAAGD
ncbi:uncharacterized protein LOC131008093 [Salvia miltiorrhiza]|uniref:uncharacterized protein LOC131008093 n=1 Tax=Salvia miltiorrhiza TaxID=226208 RepID=UPI0025ABA46B|nr:uncharacterized protein LOC131008093 [Salvia miltiorrhiza]